MIRKVVIVLLTLGAVGTGATGVVVGSGYLHWGQDWRSGEPATAGYRYTWVRWGVSRNIVVSHVKYLDAPATPWRKRWFGPGWIYQTEVALNPLSGFYYRSWNIAVSFVIPIVIFVFAAAYPTIAFIRGPVRRWRRRRKGLCLKCGYNLTGNVSGVCPECGHRPQGEDL